MDCALKRQHCCFPAAPHNPNKAYCTETFGSTKLAPVVAQGLSLPELRDGCDQIMNILRLNFYQLDYAVTSDQNRGLLIVSDRRWSNGLSSRLLECEHPAVGPCSSKRALPALCGVIFRFQAEETSTDTYVDQPHFICFRD